MEIAQDAVLGLAAPRTKSRRDVMKIAQDAVLGLAAPRTKSRRDVVKIAQDAVLGWHALPARSPGGTVENLASTPHVSLDITS